MASLDVRSWGGAGSRTGFVSGDAFRLLTLRFRGVSLISWRIELGAVLFVVSFLAALPDPQMNGPLHAVALAGLALGAVLAPKSYGPRRLQVGISLIVVSTLLAIPITLQLAPGRYVSTVILAMLTIPNVVLYASNVGLRALVWLQPCYLAVASVVFAKGVVSAGERISPMAGTSPNPWSVFLLLGSVYFLSTRRPWLGVFCASAIPFTGSRGSTFAALVIIAAMLVTRRVSWHILIPLVIIGILTATVGHASVWHRVAPSTLTQDMIKRLPTHELPEIRPKGFSDSDVYGGIHNVPFRMSVESGILAALAWVAITLWALWSRSYDDPVWWMLLALALVSQVDYFTWIGPMGGWWWLFIGMRLKEAASRKLGPNWG
jgi:hypothetical protein